MSRPSAPRRHSTKGAQQPLQLPSMPPRESAFRPREAGAPPGIDHLPELETPPLPGSIKITSMDYGIERVATHEITDLEAFLAETRPPWVTVRWINVEGLHPYVLAHFRRAYQLHTLAAEDVLHVPQRPRVEPYTQHLFVVLRMVRLAENQLASEQVSIFYLPGVVLTFQEGRAGDVWDALRTRIRTDGSRLREQNADFLLYSLIDAVVDHAFPLLEHYGEVLDALEEVVLSRATPDLLRRVHEIQRELVGLRRIIWPTRELADTLHRGEHAGISATVQTYLRDVYAHTVQILDIVETHREMCAGLTDLYMSVASHRMNEIMKVLTIMASLFIPITFLAGVYGMNFEYFPELHLRYGYFYFWLICLAVVLGLLLYFRRRHWF